MKDKVAVATVRGKAYFLIVNKLVEQNIPFTSIIPGKPIPTKIMLVITTNQEKHLINHPKILVYQSEDKLDDLIDKAKKMLLGKEVFGKITIGIDPGLATGYVVFADGKMIEKDTCFCNEEIVANITKIIKAVNFSATNVSIKIGNGVSIYEGLLDILDNILPPEVVLEVVSEEGTNKPLKENKHSRRVRHISSAVHIAGRIGNVVERGKAIAANDRIQ